MSARSPYDRHSVVSLEVGLETIRAAFGERFSTRLRYPINGVRVGCTSLRLRTFERKGTRCVGCGLEATHFAIERPRCDAGRTPEERPYHLNLWGRNDRGEEVLFTHDHLHARSTGGADSLSNTQTMCAPCNSAKSVEEGRLAEALRRVA